jgi:hypothetical protein
MKIGMRDHRVFEGSPVDIVRAIQAIAAPFRVRVAKQLLADRLEQPQLMPGACDACTVGRP